jgi:hypothetical protein
MKKSITKFMSFSLALMFTFGLTIMPNNAEATVWFAKKAWVEMRGTVIYAGLEIYGYEVPIGVTLGGGSDYVGSKEDCLFYLTSSCDDSNLRLVTIYPLHEVNPI